MRAKNIEKGGEYWTKVGEERVKVRVVSIRRGGAGVGRMRKYQVERVDNNQLLPKWRSPQALHPTGRGEWPGAMQKQEYSSEAIDRLYTVTVLGAEGYRKGNLTLKDARQYAKQLKGQISPHWRDKVRIYYRDGSEVSFE